MHTRTEPPFGAICGAVMFFAAAWWVAPHWAWYLLALLGATQVLVMAWR